MGLTDQKTSFRTDRAARIDAIAGVLAMLVFFLSAMAIPVAGIVVGIFTPLPALLFYYRWGSSLGYWVSGCTGLAGCLLLFIFNAPEGIPYLIQMLILGPFLGIGMRRQWSSEVVIGSASVLFCTMGAVLFWISYPGSPDGLVKFLEDDLQRAATELFRHSSMQGSEKGLIEGAIREVFPIFVRLLPGIGFAATLVSCWLNVLTARGYCRLRALELPAGPEWRLWKAPDQLVWLVIAGGFAVLLPYAVPKVVALNMLVVLGTVYLLQGYAITAFFFERWKLPRFFRAVVYATFLLQQFATLGAALTGFFDMWLDFRHLTHKPASDV